MKNILYIDRPDLDPDIRVMTKALRVLGDVYVAGPLSQLLVGQVRRLHDNSCYSAIISHLPPKPDSRLTKSAAVDIRAEKYGDACDHLLQIKLITEVPVIVYTGEQRENIPGMLFDRIGADNIVHKSRSLVDDAELVIQAIKAAWEQNFSLS